MNVVAAFRAEVLKLRKRPGVRILVATMAGVVLLLGYVLLYVFATQTPDDQLQGLDSALLLDALRPASLPIQVLGMVVGPGSAIALILGALAFGAEYSWRTITTIATQRPSRLALVTGRILAVLAACLVLVLAGFAGGVVGTAVVSLLEQADGGGPTVADVLSAFGVGALATAVWAAIGLCLATVLRSMAWAIGLGLLYTFAIESVVGLLPLRGRVGDLVARALIGNNVTALVIDVAPDSAATLGAPTIAIDPEQAVGVLVMYVGIALVVAVAVFIRRDIAT
ncbi:MAG: ABC transporter permease [Actinobacteria bacterium]|nr:ABC transporter permease [Actinomycetota bacterium]